MAEHFIPRRALKGWRVGKPTRTDLPLSGRQPKRSTGEPIAVTKHQPFSEDPGVASGISDEPHDPDFARPVSQQRQQPRMPGLRARPETHVETLLRDGLGSTSPRSHRVRGTPLTTRRPRKDPQ